MSEAERSIAVKRKIGVTKPMNRDDSPSDIYTPKRKRSDDTQEDASPPPYIPSRKTVAERHSQTLVGMQRGEQRQLSRNDIRHTLSQEDRRELISKSRREELLRTIGIDREYHHKSGSSHSPEGSRSHADDIKSVSYSREVRGDANSSGVKNFQITARIMSSGSSSSLHADRQRQHSPSPERKPPSRVSRDPSSHSDSKTSVTARLGKVVVERKNLAKQKDARDEINNRVALSKSSSDQRDIQRDAREDILAKVSRSKENVQRKSGVRVISRLGKEFVQKQCEAAVLSVQTTRHSDKTKISASPDSRVVHCDKETFPGSESDKDEDSGSFEYKTAVVRKELVKEMPESSGKDKNSGEDDDDEAEDLSKMIDDDIEPEILDVTNNDEFTLDLDDDDISNVIGALEEETAVADLQEHENEKDQDAKSGTRFIVTLDGVDEREFAGENANSVFDKFRRPPLASASVSVAPVVATSSEQVQQNHKLFLDLLASQGRSLQHSQVLAQSQTVPSKLTPPKIQPFSISLKDSDEEPDDKESKAAAIGAETSYYGDREEESGFSAVKKAKMSERCKFWPACAAGTACEYHHPTTHCKTFPNCKFGDKCLFIHPNCRFDSKCTRPDCPYTHTSRRTKISSAPHVIAIPPSHVVFSPAPAKSHYGPYMAPSYPTTQAPPCRFFPNCHNLNCPFTHPKPCRYGMACKSPVCSFYHPPTPGKDKLKWQAQASQAKVQEVIPTFRGNVAVKQSADSVTTSAGHSTTVSSTSQ